MSSQISLSDGVLTYQDLTDTNNLTVSYQAGEYTFRDPGVTIVSVPEGWTLSTDSNTASGPGTGVSSVAVDLSGSSNRDAVNVRSIGHPTTLLMGSGVSQVYVCSNAPTNTGNLAGIGANLSVNSNAGGYATLWISDFSATSGNTDVVVSGGTVTGFAGPADEHTISFSGTFGQVRTIGVRNLAEGYTISSPAAPYELTGESGGQTVLVTGTVYQTNIFMGNGPDSATVQPMSAITGQINFQFGDKANTLTLNATGQPGAAFDVQEQDGIYTVTGASSAPVVYRAIGGTVNLVTVGP